MMKLLMWLTTTVAGLALWAVLVLNGTANGWFRDSVAAKNDPREFMQVTVNSINGKSRGNIAFVLIEDGQVFDEFAFSIGDPVDSDSLFQGASLSKWVTAWGVMTLLEEGELDLDEPVSNYLTRWQLEI